MSIPSPRTRLRRAATAAAVLPVVVLAAACGSEQGSDAGTDRDDAAATSTAAEPVVDHATTAEPPAEPSEPSEPSEPGVPAAATTRIPADFPLAEGLPRRNGDDGTPVEVTAEAPFDGFELCGEPAWSTRGEHPVADVAGVSYTGEAEDFRGRTLALYPDADAATAALDDLRVAFAACDDEEVGGTVQAYDEADVPLPDGVDDGVVIEHRYGSEAGFDTGLELLELFRVGNALYVSSYYGEANGSPETVRGFLDFAAESSAPVVTAMDAFAEA